MTISIDEMRLVEDLVMRKGHIRTSHRLFLFMSEGEVYFNTKNKLGYSEPSYSVPKKLIKSLFMAHNLLTCRILDRDWRDNVIWEVYKPQLQKYECFKELTAQYALGTV